MTWKKGFFSEVKITPEFGVSLLNNRGIEMYNRLAAGETVCLAFAFSLTLSNEAGLNFPMIVDTPMGRLAPEVQANLAQVIVDSTRGKSPDLNHQIIMLMTETEYNHEVAGVFAARHPKVLEIHFDTRTAETVIK
jgi:DNA sulfur modification protein DndD